jgi:hypothetical protein
LNENFKKKNIDNMSGLIGKVLYPYSASSGDEITIEMVGAEVIVSQQFPNGWSKVVYNGIEGLFPTDYMEITENAVAKKTAPPPPNRLKQVTNQPITTTNTQSKPPITTTNTQLKPPITTTNTQLKSPLFTQPKISAPPTVSPPPITTVPTPTSQPPTPSQVLSTLNIPLPVNPISENKHTKSGSEYKDKRKTKMHNIQQQKIAAAAISDNSRIDKMNKISDEIEKIHKKDISDLQKLIQKYHEAIIHLSSIGSKVASELVKLGEKYKDISYGIKLIEFGNDFEVLEEGRGEAIKNVPPLSKELDEKIKRFEVLEKSVKETNKKYDIHLKKQVDKISNILENDAALKAMGELTQMVKEIDDNRDQMISQFGFYKTTIFQTITSYFLKSLLTEYDFLISISNKFNAHKNVLKQIDCDVPAQPPITWEQYNLRDISEPTIKSAITPPQQKNINFPQISIPPIDNTLPSYNNNNNNLSPYTSSPSYNNNLPSYNSSSYDSSSLTEPTSSKWQEYFTEDGYKYYYNAETGESRWDEPT